MERKRITCPEVGRLVEIGFERTSRGIVVAQCSRFHPACELTCPRECARRMDRRDRVDVESQERVLIALADDDAPTVGVADLLAQLLALDRFAVERATLGTGMPPLADYDAVVLGTAVRFGRRGQPLESYIRDQLDELRAMPAFLFVVGGSGRLDPGRHLTYLAQRTAWYPTGGGAFHTGDTALRWAVLDLAHRIADEVPAAAPIAMW